MSQTGVSATGAVSSALSLLQANERRTIELKKERIMCPERVITFVLQAHNLKLKYFPDFLPL